MTHLQLLPRLRISHSVGHQVWVRTASPLAEQKVAYCSSVVSDFQFILLIGKL
jgi:hypothetical protein